MARILCSIICGFAAVTLIGCGGHSGEPQAAAQIPDFRIVDLVNTSTEEQKRFRIKVALPSHYSENSVKATLPVITKTLMEPESEITVLFYGPHSDPQGVYDVARVIWMDDGIEEIDYKQPVPAEQRRAD